MEQVLKVVALSLGIAAVAVLAFFGFAIWVFIPLLPAAIVYLAAIYGIKHRAVLPARESEVERDKKAA
jgi:hypothetical protein